MLKMATRCGGLGLLALSMAAVPASAQVLGTFSWQQQPYCNVITVTVVQVGANYQMDGTDDQCGSTRKASATGLGFVNANGFIGIGLTIITNSGGTGGTPLHLDAVIDTSANGTWRDSTGGTGPFTFVTGPVTGTPRPIPVTAFLNGLSAGNARITSVGAPLAAGDAANKGYVDAGQSALRADLFRQFTLSGQVGSTGGKLYNGPFTSARTSVGAYVITYNVTGLGIPASFLPGPMVATVDQFCPGGSAQGGWSSVVTFGGVLTTFTYAVRTTNAAGAATDCTFSFLATFQPQAALPPVSAAPFAGAANNLDAAVTCQNTPDGPVCK